MRLSIRQMCGKTTSAEMKAKSTLYMNEPQKSATYLQLAKMSPKTLLAGETPRLVDEWQLAPSLWDAIRFEVDHLFAVRSTFVLLPQPQSHQLIIYIVCSLRG